MRIDRFLEPPAPVGRFHQPVWNLGFRPFFLAAALLATLFLPLWLLIFLGGAHLPLALPPVDWHLHELVFGFAGAVLVGFLLTAARNWTSRPTASGGFLAAIVGLWLAGRVVVLVGASLPDVVVAGAAIAYLPVAAFALARPLLAARNRRNYAFPILLLALAGVGLAFHVADPGARRAFGRTAVDIVVIFLVVMGGRVIPFFTRNALKDRADRVRTHPAVDWATAVATGLVAIFHLLGLREPVDVAALVAGLLNLVRVGLWSPWITLGRPILWVLHLGYAWIGVGLLLEGLAPFLPALGGTAPLHALTVGALGTLSLGMMARVSLGHTGRPLEVSRAVVVAFVCMSLAAATRAVIPLVAPALYAHALEVSGILFAAAWCIFVIVYWPILTRPRADGAPG